MSSPPESASTASLVDTAPYRGVGIGAGYFAPFQYEAWERLPGVEITAIANPTEEKARTIMSRYGIPRYYGDWREMLDREQPDFVDIITPPGTHEEMCAYAAQRGIHIICQKPLAPTLGEAERIVRNAQERGVRFMVHENWRWQPWYREIRRIRDRGDIGEFTHLYFRMRTGDGWGEDAYLARQPFFRKYPRLLIFETGVHFIDTFRFLLGEVATVYARLRRLNPVIQGEDAGQVVLTFVGGATAILDANRYNEVDAATPRYTFGTLRIDGMGGHLTMDTDSNIQIKRLGSVTTDVSYERENRNFAGDCVYFLQQHFLESLRSGRAFESNGADYLETIRVVEAVYESAATGSVVTLRPA